VLSDRVSCLAPVVILAHMLRQPERGKVSAIYVSLNSYAWATERMEAKCLLAAGVSESKPLMSPGLSPLSTHK
jgi:hypothetical protein